MRDRLSFCWVFVIGLLFATVSCGAADEPVDGDAYDDSFRATSGGADRIAPEENSAEARAILEVVNTYSLHGLIRDARLYYNGARGVIDHRNGADGMRNTPDDMYLRSMAELDRVPFIGKKSMQRLREYVAAAGLIEAHAVEYGDVVPARIDTRLGAAFRGEIGPSDIIRIPLRSELGDRILIWFRKGSRAQWNPRVKLIDGDTGETVASANPWGNTDARLPLKPEEASRGFEVDRDPANYVVVLDNTSRIAGEYEFWLECLGGPCAPVASAKIPAMDGDFGDLEDDELRAQMVARHELTHTYIDYYAARRVMFEDIDNHSGWVECVYTGETVQTESIPSNLEMNAEHTWPQSKGAVDGAARSDLHHLFPVTSVVNSLRANHPYCEVDEVLEERGGSKYGDTAGVRCFEPRDEHKGNAARAMFYFAAVYQQPIDDREEAVLRRWAAQDPVDRAERSRHTRIATIQGSKNPFVEDPTLLDRIANF